jgi:molecular chaperone GrpE
MFNKGSKKKKKSVKDKDLNVQEEQREQKFEENPVEETAGTEQDDKSAEETTSGENTSEAPSETEVLQKENQELRDKYLRLYAEFDNYKKRTIKEKVDLMKTASADIIKNLLPVLDDFDRAKKIADDENSTEEFSEGVTLVYNKLYNILKSKGLQPMESDGEAFDPDFHEAITEIPAPSDEMKGKIIDTIEKGYMLNDAIIRHAKVVVGK